MPRITIQTGHVNAIDGGDEFDLLDLSLANSDDDAGAPNDSDADGSDDVDHDVLYDPEDDLKPPPAPAGAADRAGIADKQTSAAASRNADPADGYTTDGEVVPVPPVRIPITVKHGIAPLKPGFTTGEIEDDHLVEMPSLELGGTFIGTSSVDDLIQGIGWDDFTSGSGGDDMIFGNGENDIIVGGYGDDTLEGVDWVQLQAMIVDETILA